MRETRRSGHACPVISFNLPLYAPSCREVGRLLKKSVLGRLRVSDWARNTPEWAFLMSNREPESGTKEFFNTLWGSRKSGPAVPSEARGARVGRTAQNSTHPIYLSVDAPPPVPQYHRRHPNGRRQ